MSTIHIATIGAPFGVRGLFRLKTFTELPEDVLSYGALTDEKGQKYSFKLIRIEDTRTLVVSSDAVPDRTAAEALRGIKLYAEKLAIPKIEDEHTFYIHDLIGADVISTEGEHIGTLYDIENYGAGDILVIKTEDGYKQIAFQKDGVPEVDKNSKKIIVVKEFLL